MLPIRRRQSCLCIEQHLRSALAMCAVDMHNLLPFRVESTRVSVGQTGPRAAARASLVIPFDLADSCVVR